MKFKSYINSEINQKEVEPSHDSWDRIQARLQSQPTIVEKSNSSKWWFIAAVVIGLLATSTMYFIQKNDDTLVEPAFVKEQNIEAKANDETNLEQPISKNSEEKEIVSNSTNQQFKSTENSNENIKVEKLEKTDKPNVSVENKEVVFKEIPEIKIAVNVDTAKINPKKKSNYVDPNMLLYSIENKEALKETNNSKSKVTIIDFNK